MDWAREAVAGLTTLSDVSASNGDGSARARRIGRGEDTLQSALDACKPHFRAAQIFSALIALLYIAPSIYMLQIYNRVLTTGGLLTLAFMSVLLALALITHALLDEIRQRLLARASIRLDRLLARDIVRQSFTLQRDAQPRNAQILREFDTFRQTISGQAALARLDLPYAPIFVIVCFILHPALGLLVLGGAILLVVIAVQGDRATRRALAAASENAPVSYAAAEMGQALGGAVRALGMREAMLRRLVAGREAMNVQGVRTTFLATRYSGLIRLLRMTLQSAALGLGAFLAVRGDISPGALIAASILAGRALAPIEQTVGAWRQITLGRTARKTLVEFLDKAPLARDFTDLPAPKGRVSVEAVSMRMGERLALENVSFEIQPGEVLGVIGPSGAGKSTLAQVLVGAMAPDAGIVRIDGSNIADWEGDSLGAHVGYMPQEAALFSGTIAENISRFSTASDAGIKAVLAAQSAGAHAMIQRLPRGYDTQLGPRGEGLSAGQSQRIALARALHNDPTLIVLDEPNSHLDSDGDSALLQALQQAKARGASIVVMTHRTGVLTSVDRMLVLREGCVEMNGTAQDVLAALRKSAAQSGQVRAVGSTS